MFQTAINLTDTPKTEYNGWSDWTTWNCALWIGMMRVFINGKRFRDYGMFVEFIVKFIWTKHLTEQSGRKQTSPKCRR